jgi:anti-sigma-K factor RskA
MADEQNGHGEIQELLTGYALGGLTPEEHARVQAHLRVCAECSQRLRSLSVLAEGLGRAVPQMEPPLGLRSRVLAAAVKSPPAKTTRPAPAGWLLLAASIAALVAGGYTLMLRQQVRALQQEIAQMRAEAQNAANEVAQARQQIQAAQDTLQILAAPDVTQVQMAGQAPAAGATGRALLSQSRGLVVSASALPALPPGRVYQLWIVPDGAPPVSAGLMTPDASGRATAVLTGANLPMAAAIAITLEPAGGVPTPTGPMYLVGKV